MFLLFNKNNLLPFLLSTLNYVCALHYSVQNFLPPWRQSESHFRNRRPINDAPSLPPVYAAVLSAREGSARNLLIQRETDACQNGG